MGPEINMGMMRINTDNAPVSRDAPEGRVIYLGSVLGTSPSDS